MGIRFRANRSGLAPLELVLALPVLLFLMALMINYGTVASWKVRGLATARHAAWSGRWPRRPDLALRPDYWPPSASIGTGAARDVVRLDDPRVNLPVARGPLPGDNMANERLLNPARGPRYGRSELVRDFPLLATLGEYHLQSQEELLDDGWQFRRTGWPEANALLPANVWRRIPVIYALARVDPALVHAYMAAVSALMQMPLADDLRPLETWTDEEYLRYSARFEWPLARIDFHPRLRLFCSVEDEDAEKSAARLILRIRGETQRNEQGDIVRRIPGVPDCLAGTLIQLYRRVIQELEGRIREEPPPPPNEIVRMQAEIDDLQQRIRILDEFRRRLQADDG